MRILAIETVGTSGSVAALDDERVAVEERLDAGRRSAQSLAPAIARLLESAGWRASDVQLVAVATGPGSFTGLRIGVTTAKTFAYAVGCPALGVHTLWAIARQAPASPVWAVLDAQRQELFAARYVRNCAGQLREDVPTGIVGRDAWLARLAAGEAVSGPGLEKLVDRLPAEIEMIGRELWAPRAATIGHLGRELHAAHAASDPLALVPQYFRRTAAEEKADCSASL